jgi:hypothetical protein
LLARNNHNGIDRFMVDGSYLTVMTHPNVTDSLELEPQVVEIEPLKRPDSMDMLYFERGLNAEEAVEIRAFLLQGLCRATELSEFSGAVNQALNPVITSKLHAAAHFTDKPVLDSSYGAEVGTGLLLFAERKPGDYEEAAVAWTKGWLNFMVKTPIEVPVKTLVSGSMSHVFKVEVNSSHLNGNEARNARYQSAVEARQFMRTAKTDNRIRLQP